MRSFQYTMRRHYHIFILLMSIGIFEAGCVHRIHLPSLAADVATASIPATAQVVMPVLAIEGADHMPGITLLEWRRLGGRAELTCTDDGRRMPQVSEE